ncbi:MAG: S-layer homology domain-containing protein, partial [Desulfocucumaceae bacterium]
MLFPGNCDRPVFHKKRIALLLFAALIGLLMMAPALAMAGEPVFSDLNSGNQVYPYINYLVNKDLLKGYPDGTFRPGSSITRAETAALLAKAAGILPANPGSPTFSDVSPGHWAYGTIEAAASAGLVRGYPDGSFLPDLPVTRAETAVLLLKLTSRPLPAVALPPTVRDVGASHWASKTIAAALGAGLLEVDGNNSFAPEVPAQRSQVARGLALMLIISPERSEVALTGTLVPVKGEVLIKESGTELRKISSATLCGVGAVIKTGPGSEADLNFSDGSGFKLTPNTEIVIKEARGRASIMRDGSPGATVNYLRVQINSGRMFGALASGYIQGKDEKKANNSPVGLRHLDTGSLLASARPYPLAVYLAQNEEELPWWETAAADRVRVEVDMPWGVAGVRGTFWMNEVLVSQAVTTVADGAVELSASGETVVVPKGYSSTIASPPSRPRMMSNSEQAAWSQVRGWVQERAQAIQEGVVTAPPQIVQQIINAVVNSPANSPQTVSHNSSGGDSAPPVVSSSSPADGAFNVAVNSPVTITFNEAIQAGEAYNNISLTDANGVSVTLTKSISGNTLTLSPVTPLNNG